MLTHHLRVPGRVSAVSRATAAGKVPSRQLGKWRAETDTESSSGHSERQSRHLAVLYCKTDGYKRTQSTLPPPHQTLSWEGPKSHSKWYKPYDFCSFCRAKKVSVTALFSVVVETNINKGFLFLSCTQQPSQCLAIFKSEIAQYWLLPLICFFSRKVWLPGIIKEPWACSLRSSQASLCSGAQGTVLKVPESLLGPQPLCCLPSKNWHCYDAWGFSFTCFL